jgi:TonB family protein
VLDQGLKGLFRCWRRSFGIAILLFSLLGVAPAQEQPRKVVAKTAPSYPEMAKKMHLTGKVKLEAVVSARGAVTSAKLVGGNPIFETSAVEAIKKWRFEPAEKDTKAVLVVEFTDQ